MPESATYTHGHHPSVLQAHSWRTATNSAAYLLPHLTSSSNSSLKILDLGCGAGTITVDLAAHAPHAHITGLDISEDVLRRARTLATQRGISNIEFATGDANSLPYEDGTFDIVHAHQVLQHVSDPVGVLREMKRVTKVGGIVAARDADYGVFVWYPETEGLERWRELFCGVARRNGGDLHAGRKLHVWAKQAGFTDVSCSTSSWCYSQREEVRMWSETWAERTAGEGSSFVKSAVEAQLATREELERIAAAWRRWGEDKDAWISVPSGEIICQKI
ncbi:hypothetical protein ASPWEDRAFT_34401 [Aspergillus wentii DTO 134E9]|uniref:Methyltransferase domain-containing protein n=1 Tax=Aspergillus wentii DTO 134E9 TaxID=1073089 RepID=A0A1L9S1B1_ASPWE|nr:uncharacterized protein ASPWEDRAFT_34401 [Aspergillus wentii DTO 134E9]KAI9931063.1 hypothetical protein MW887_010720 [Aspergillus wentii]OJJ40941.1 hypothetical protein ASPWEDRAFT_34401 [Aspergillus wentii DTO 134E9]